MNFKYIKLKRDLHLHNFKIFTLIFLKIKNFFIQIYNIFKENNENAK
jgi:hypothetical protein